MPQRDDKVQLYFGRIPAAVWDRMDEPGATVERAVALLVEAIKAGRTIRFPPTLRAKQGIAKKLWLIPETAEAVERIAEENHIRNTPVILAALNLYWSSPAGEASHQRGPQPGTPTTSEKP